MVQLVSRRTGASGEPAHEGCIDAAISADGRQVAFTCDGPLVAADTNDVSDVYVRNLDTQVTTLVSVASDGTVGDAPRREARDRGRTAARRSSRSSRSADNLDQTVPAGQRFPRIYLRRITPAVSDTLLVSNDGDAATHGGDAESPSISDDGLRVAFDTRDDLTGEEQNGSARRLRARLPRQPAENDLRQPQDRRRRRGPATAARRSPLISGDGSLRSCSRPSSARPRQDAGGGSDVYLRSLADETTTLVSAANGGTHGNGPSARRRHQL